jgi:hypothetical protein
MKIDRVMLRKQAEAISRVTGVSPWQLQTSNSFRRIGTKRGGDGDVLCGVKHPIDAHPDLQAAPGVLDYIVAMQPLVVIDLLDQIDELRAIIEQVAPGRLQRGDGSPL